MKKLLLLSLLLSIQAHAYICLDKHGNIDPSGCKVIEMGSYASPGLKNARTIDITEKNPYLVKKNFHNPNDAIVRAYAKDHFGKIKELITVTAKHEIIIVNTTGYEHDFWFSTELFVNLTDHYKKPYATILQPGQTLIQELQSEVDTVQERPGDYQIDALTHNESYWEKTSYQRAYLLVTK